MNKYRNQETVVDGIKFQSKKEANRYCELKLLEKAKEIEELKLQPKFVLQEGFKKDGVTYRPITYIADFSYIYKSRIVVEDVKSEATITPVFKLKQKLFEYNYPYMKLELIK